MNNEDEVDKFINELIDMGLLIEHINDVTGEKSYEIPSDVKERAPFLWEIHMKDIKKAIYRMWQHGMVDIMFSEEGPLADVVTLTDLAFNKDAVDALPEIDKVYLEHLIKIFADNNYN